MALIEGKYVLCGNSAKRCHLTRADAKRHLESLRKEKGYEGYIYPCHSCGMYHVGRVKLRAHKNKYAK